MAPQKVNARDLIFQVLDDDDTTWLGISNLNEITMNPSEDEEETDTTVYESDGDAEHEKMQRGASAELSGFQTLDSITGAPDPGQARCEDMATKKGPESHGSVRFRHPLQTTWRVWPKATFSAGEQGGGNNDKTSWGMTIKRSGSSTTAAVV
ncbi:hypothetical protein [Saccharothrix sp. HUAS TT1]|uniref:phage tail tube protein n=1 Tax=unclassified Saccharothrix TaxID=2593673 RepID=UPI00345C2E44